MKRVIKFDYDETILKALKSHELVVVLDSFEQIEYKYAETRKNNHVLAMCVQLPYSSLSQIVFREDWGQIPIVINAYNIGDYYLFFSKVDIIKSLNIRIFLSDDSDSVFTDLKILSSLGIDCGIQFVQGKKIKDDAFLDLASYYYMSPVPHATMEPFDFILKHLLDEKNIGFDGAFFDDSLQFVSVKSIDDLSVISLNGQDEFNLKMEQYYNHFMNLDECSKCPAFKICNKHMMDVLDDCHDTMNELFEYAELRNDMNLSKPTKTICQL